MIPLIISIILSFILFHSDKIDPQGKGMVVFLAFVATLWFTNYITFLLLKDERVNAKIYINDVIPKIGMGYYVFDSTKIYGNELVRIPNRRVKRPYIIIEVERKILPKNKNLLLTAPIFWFDPINKWEENREGVIKLYSKQKNGTKNKQKRFIFARNKRISCRRDIKYF